MLVVIKKDYEEVSREAARIVAGARSLRRKNVSGVWPPAALPLDSTRIDRAATAQAISISRKPQASI